MKDGGVVEVTWEQLQMGRGKETSLLGLSWWVAAVRSVAIPSCLAVLYLPRFHVSVDNLKDREQDTKMATSFQGRSSVLARERIC